MSQPTIAVVIVNWNSREDVLAAVRSLREQTDPDLEIVVVDNGSTDGSAAAIRAEFPLIQVIEAGENLGFAEGCNRGIAATRSDWVFLFNNDAVAEPTCVTELRRAAAAAPDDVGMLQPLIVFTSRPTNTNSSGVTVYRSGHARDRSFFDPVEQAQSAGDPFCSTAAAALYRRTMLEHVRLASGYLDRHFFMYFEDVDLGWRSRLAGYRAVYVPAARVRHRLHGSSKRRGKSFVSTQCRVNRVAMIIHNASIALILRGSVATILDMLLVLWDDGPGRFLSLLRWLPTLLRDRARIARFSRTGRRELEREWMTRNLEPMPALDLPDRHG